MTALEATFILLVPIGKIVAWTLLYAIYKGGLAKAVTPYRKQLAAEGEALLAMPDLSDEERGFVEFSLDNACDWRPMLVALFIAPLLAVTAVFRWRPWNRAKEVRFKSNDNIKSGFFIKTFVSFYAASPLVGTAFVCGFVFYCVLGILFLKSFRFVGSSLKSIFSADAMFIGQGTRGVRRYLKAA